MLLVKEWTGRNGESRDRRLVGPRQPDDWDIALIDPRRRLTPARTTDRTWRSAFIPRKGDIIHLTGGAKQRKSLARTRG